MKPFRLAMILVALAAVMCGSPAHGGLLDHKTELPEWFRKQLHKWDDYKILVVKGKNPTNEVDKLVAAPDEYRLVVWQVTPELTRESDVRRLLTWVSEGGTLWFQDSRLSEWFGFENAPIDGSVFPPEAAKAFKPSTGDYGGVKKTEGANMFSFKVGSPGHPVLSGVDTVQLFSIKVGEGEPGSKIGKYSAVKRDGKVTPLLCFDATSNGPLSDRLAAALRAEGDGYIVFKPLVWEEQFNGGRFQYNLLEWSSGFGVPDPTASAPSGRKPRRKSSGATAEPVAVDARLDQVTFLDKHVEAGTILNKDFKLVVFEPVLTTTTYPMDKVSEIVVQADGSRDAVQFRNGTRIFGSITFPDDLAIRSTSGSVRKVKKSEILRITVHDPAATQAPEKGK